MPVASSTMPLPKQYDTIAADGSQVRVLLAMKGASTVHCTLRPDTGSPPGVSLSTVNTGIDEIWYFLRGQGLVWLKDSHGGQPIEAYPGVSVTIPEGTVFQFRNTGTEPLEFLCITMPPWSPGTNEAVDECFWPVGPAAH